MVKRPFALLLAICLTCCLCACGNTGNTIPSEDAESGKGNVSDAPLPLPVINEKTGKVYPVQFEYEYDNDGRIIKQTETDSEYSGGACTYEYDYDNTGKRVCSRMYRENVVDYRKTVYEYDTNGNLTISKEYLISAENPDGELSYMTLYEYDSEGREIKNEHYTYFVEEQFFNRRTEKEYNEDGKLSKISYYDADGLTEYMLYYYDGRGATSAYETFVANGGQETLFDVLKSLMTAKSNKMPTNIKREYSYEKSTQHPLFPHGGIDYIAGSRPVCPRSGCCHKNHRRFLGCQHLY